MNLLSAFAMTVLSSVPSPSQQSQKADTPLVKVQPKTGSPIVGQLIDETNEGLRVLDLRTGNELVLNRLDLLRMTKNLSEKEVISSVGLPAFVAWRLGSLLDSSLRGGKVIRVADGTVYVSIGTKTSNELPVCR